MNYNLENFSNYDTLTIGKLRAILKWYPYLRNWAEGNGDEVALCLAMDIEDALKNAGLTKEEYFCIYEYFVIGEISHGEIGTKIDKSHTTVRRRTEKGLFKILHYLKTGKQLEL